LGNIVSSDTSTEGKPQTRFLAGAVWMVSMRWAMRFVGLFSTIILARLLTPQDFGLVAMAMIVVALLDTLSSTGVDLALIRERDSSSKLYNAAWTIQILQNALVAALMVAAVPMAIDYFDEPRLQHILYWLALSQLIMGCRNIGTVAFRQELDFAKEFRYSLYVKLIGFVATVSLALTLQDYRAIVYGVVLKSFFELIISYRMHPYRPKLSFQGMGRIWGFSQWLLLSSLIGVINSKASQFIIGGSIGAAALGFYYMAIELGTMFVHEVVMPIRRALFPNMSLLLDDREAFIHNSIKIVGIISLVSVPIGVGLHLVASEFIALLLGPQWVDAVAILEWTALYGGVTGISLGLNLILMVQKKVHLTAIQLALESVVLLPLLVWVSKSGTTEDIAIANLLVAIAFLPLTVVMVVRTLKINFGVLGEVMWRPVLAGAAMFYIDALLLEDVSLNVVLSLAAHIFLGIVSYGIAIGLLWLASGRPKTAEATIVEIACNFLPGNRNS